MDNIAFGTSKITLKNQEHIQAIKNALKLGVKAIQTSPNYMNQEAQRAISVVFSELDDSYRDEIKIINKQHISQNFHEMLSLSLKNLNIETIDTYLIELERFDEKELFDLFLDLELAIQEGKIKTYGVSSYNLLNYDHILEIANDVQKELRIQNSGFKTIEFALNLIKQDTIKALKWAKMHNIETITIKPFSVFENEKIFKLIDYNESVLYDTYLNELLEICDNELLQPLYNLILSLDEKKHRFDFADEWNMLLFKEVLPRIKDFIIDLDEQNQQTLLNYIDIFLQEYTKMVKYECSKKTRLRFADTFSTCKESMQECALNFLKQQDGIDYVVIGMPKPMYVYDVLNKGGVNDTF